MFSSCRAYLRAMPTSCAVPPSVEPSSHSVATPVYFDHDGGSDDFVALVYLLKHQQRFNLLGVTVTPANSWWKVGTSATRKILRIFSGTNVCASDGGRVPVPVAESTLPSVNPFPNAWRYDSCKVNLLPQLNPGPLALTEDAHPAGGGGEGGGGEEETNVGVSGQLLLAQTLMAASSPVTLIATGPLTNLAWVLDNFPEACSKIDRVLIMGGAIDVPGNASAKHTDEIVDETAEWNFFWDPQAAKRIWDSDLTLVLTPLDATNNAPVTKDMLLRIGQHHHSASSTLVGTIWALAGGHFMETGEAFFAFDLLTVAQLVHPELFTTEEVECDIVSEGVSQGRVVRTGAGHDRRGGRSVTVVRARDAGEMFDVIFAELSS